jgi:hypothetical protein
MAIDPPSDIVLDVARAADPTRAASVIQKLNTMAANAPAGDVDFAQAVDEASNAAGTSSSTASTAADLRVRLAHANDLGGPDKADKAKTQFEAMLLTNLIGEMLPKDTPTAFGEGLSGDMWRSLLAEKMSEQIAKSGALGISRRLFDGGRSPATAALTGSSHPSTTGHPDVTTTSGNDLSLPLRGEIMNGAYLFARSKTS